MTRDEMYIEMGKAQEERRFLEKKIVCLQHRLRDLGVACSAVAVDPLNSEPAMQHMNNAGDPREDWAELKKALARLDELRKVLDD